MIKVSVIILVYKVEEYIEKCIRSLFSQTLDGIEFIFINDATPDNSISIIKSVAKEYQNLNVQIIEHFENRGSAAARNTGLNNAKGEYVIFCDGDDWVDTSIYEKMYEKAKLDDADLVLTNFRQIFKDKEDIYNVPYCEDKEMFLRNYINSHWTVVWNVLVKRSLIMDQSISFIEGDNYCEDFNFSVKLIALSKKLSFINEPLYYYNRTNINSIVNNISYNNAIEQLNNYDDVIKYFKQYNIWEIYKKNICWCYLKPISGLVLKKEAHNILDQREQEIKKYIWDCPYLGYKIKFIIWSYYSGLRNLCNCIIDLRILLNR